jgi:hypothetical protein
MGQTPSSDKPLDKYIFGSIYMCWYIGPQSLEVSKIKKNKKNFEKFWSSIINIDDQNFSKFFLFFFIFETSSDCDWSRYNPIDLENTQSNYIILDYTPTSLKKTFI